MIYQDVPAQHEEWVQEDVAPFDELMVSWNAERPEEGGYDFYVSVKVEEWSPWLHYAYWGSEGQKSFHSTTEEAPVKVFQDGFEVLDQKKATDFRIKVIARGDASFDRIHRLHVYVNSDKVKEEKQVEKEFSSIRLDVPPISQMALDHIRNNDLCSPTSTTAVVGYFLGESELDATSLADRAWDGGFNIFGNWVFNVAEAASRLGPNFSCWVERLNGFDDIYYRLQKETPVVVSVRGPLPGSAQPYTCGHLMVVVGYDPDQKRVLCMDPAFPSDKQTHVSYDLSEFISAWNRRGRVAYVFERAS